jgi:hypothetical protein
MLDIGVHSVHLELLSFKLDDRDYNVQITLSITLVPSAF